MQMHTSTLRVTCLHGALFSSDCQTQHWDSRLPKQRSRVQTPFLLFDSVVLCMVCNQKWLAEWVGAASVIVASNTNQIDYSEQLRDF